MPDPHYDESFFVDGGRSIERISHPMIPVPIDVYWFVQCDFCGATRNTRALVGTRTSYRASEKTGAWCCGGCVGPWEAARSWYRAQAPWRSLGPLLERALADT